MKEFLEEHKRSKYLLKMLLKTAEQDPNTMISTIKYCIKKEEELIKYTKEIISILEGDKK